MKISKEQLTKIIQEEILHETASATYIGRDTSAIKRHLIAGLNLVDHPKKGTLSSGWEDIHPPDETPSKKALTAKQKAAKTKKRLAHQKFLVTWKPSFIRAYKVLQQIKSLVANIESHDQYGIYLGKNPNDHTEAVISALEKAFQDMGFKLAHDLAYYMEDWIEYLPTKPSNVQYFTDLLLRSINPNWPGLKWIAGKAGMMQTLDLDAAKKLLKKAGASALGKFGINDLTKWYNKQVGSIASLSDKKVDALIGKVRGIEKTTPAFRRKVIAISRQIGTHPRYLMGLMAWETGFTFNSSTQRPGGPDTGLIQFLPFRAKQLGTTTAKLVKMSAIDQLDYVKGYFLMIRQNYKKHCGSCDLSNFKDLYMAGLQPTAIGKPLNHVLFSKTSKNWKHFKVFDTTADGKVTIGEVIAKIEATTFR